MGVVSLLINTGFEPVYFRLKELVLASYVLGVDDTPLKVLAQDHSAGIRRGHLWAYVGYEGCQGSIGADLQLLLSVVVLHHRAKELSAKDLSGVHDAVTGVPIRNRFLQ